MLSSIKIDFAETEGKGLQPVIKIRQEDSDDPRDGLLKSFFQKLGGQSSWLAVSFDHFIEDTNSRQGKRFITISPLGPDELQETIDLIQKRITGETANHNFEQSDSIIHSQTNIMSGNKEHQKDTSSRRKKAEDKFTNSASEFQKNAGIARDGGKDPVLPRETIIDELQNFLDENGLFEKFNSFIAQKGYQPAEFGMDAE